MTRNPALQGDFGFAAATAASTWTARPGDVAQEPEELFETAIAAFTEVLAQHPVVLAWSGGKDSTAVVILGLLALERMRAAGTRPMAPVHVLNGDTGVENPAVRILTERKSAQLVEWCAAAGHDVRLVVAEPRLADAWVVNVLSGGALPVYPNSRRRTCTVKLKIDPARIALRNVRATLEAEGVAGTRMVTAIGTRFEESEVRRRNMESRGETASVLADHDGRLLMSPIADWLEETVWELIGSAGTAMGLYPVWAPDFRDVVAAYRDAASGECPVVAGAGRQGRTGCGARFGCLTCVTVRTDKSLEAMAADARHAHLRPLLAVRDFMMAIQCDWGRRSWLTRCFAGEGAARMVKVQPDHFDGPTLMAITAAYLHADHAEALRAEAFALALDAGRDPDDAYVAACRAAGREPAADYLATMRRPAFHMIDDRKLVALDFYASLMRRHPRPHAVLETAHRIQHEGWVPPPLPMVDVPASPAPAARWLPIGDLPYGFPGLGEPLAPAFAEPCFGADEIHGDGTGSYVARDAPAFDVDPEAASLAVGLLYPDDWRRNVHDDPSRLPHEAVRAYLSTGIVALSPQGRTRLHAISKARQHLEFLGLYGLDRDALLARCVPPGQGPAAVPQRSAKRRVDADTRTSAGDPSLAPTDGLFRGMDLTGWTYSGEPTMDWSGET